MKSVFGGPGSGPQPGHRSPWYDRGSKGQKKSKIKGKLKPKSDDPKGVGTGTKEDPIVTSDAAEAAKALSEDKFVQLNQPDEVATLLDELAANVAEAKKLGEDAPSYNLCNVSVPGTNLFCVESKGIPRIKMPQLGGTPLPGSPAAALAGPDGTVDLSQQFREMLVANGGAMFDDQFFIGNSGQDHFAGVRATEGDAS